MKTSDRKRRSGTSVRIKNSRTEPPGAPALPDDTKRERREIQITVLGQQSTEYRHLGATGITTKVFGHHT